MNLQLFLATWLLSFELAIDVPSGEDGDAFESIVANII